MADQPPTQAGRFKPRKPAARGASVKAPTTSNTGRDESSGRGASGNSTGPAAGRGRGRDGGRGGRAAGRDGRGRGRGRGRFADPKGQVFFTGSATASDGAAKKGTAKSVTTMESTMNEDVVFMPGMGASAAHRGSKESSRVGNTTQERMAASALARSGEGEEVIVGEMEEGAGIGDGKKRRGKLEGSGNDMGPSMFENEEEDKVELSAAEYTYDSDSSADGDVKRAADQTRARSHILQPQRLPFPPPRKPGTDELEILYKSQMPQTRAGKKEKSGEIMKKDPPLRSPFLNLKEATADQRKEEQFSWMVFKLPTRLPRLAPHCTLSGRAMKNEVEMDIDPIDLSLSGIEPGDAPMPAAVPSSSTRPLQDSVSNTVATGYDDTLKDAAAGRYGKIVVHKSGKAYLVVGGADSKTPQVKMLLSEGLPCGFLQQAVAIDPNQASYSPLGEVKKSIVVTPDIESAFGF